MMASGPARKSSFVLPKSLSLAVPNVSTGVFVFLRSREGELRRQDVRRADVLQNRTCFFLFTTTAGVALLRAALGTVEDPADP